MKNIVLSIIAAMFVLAASAYAANIDVQDAIVSFNTDDGGHMVLVNNLNTSAVVTLNSEIVLDSNNKINVTLASQETLAPFQTKNVSVKTTSTKDLQSGIYTGTLNLVAVNQSNLSQMFSTEQVGASVLIPALKVKGISVTPSTFKKGEKITVTVDYENTADKTDLEDITVDVTIYEGQDNKLSKVVEDIDGDELQDDTDVSDLKHGKSASETFEFTMPFDVNDKDDFTAFVKVTARNDEITSQSFTATKAKEFKAKVLDSEVRISNLQTPTALACGVKTAKFSVEVQNIGDQSEDVQIFVRNPSTGFEKMLNNGEDVSLDDQFTDLSDFTQEVVETVALTDLKSGANTYNVVAYYDDGKKTATEEVVISSQCEVEATAPSTTEPDVVVTTPTTTSTSVPVQTIPNLPPASSTPYVALKDVSGYRVDTEWLVPVVIGVGGLIIGLAVALLVVPRR